jgi:putative NAD(P)H nitroreductase
LKAEENIRNASLSTMLFMLAAKDKGWDTCPMHVHNPEIIKQIFNIPENHQPVMMITLGKAVEGKVRPRGYRKPVGEFVHFVD